MGRGSKTGLIFELSVPLGRNRRMMKRATSTERAMTDTTTMQAMMMVIFVFEALDGPELCS